MVLLGYQRAFLWWYLPPRGCKNLGNATRASYLALASMVGTQLTISLVRSTGSRHSGYNCPPVGFRIGGLYMETHTFLINSGGRRASRYSVSVVPLALATAFRRRSLKVLIVSYPLWKKHRSRAPRVVCSAPQHQRSVVGGNSTSCYRDTQPL